MVKMEKEWEELIKIGVTKEDITKIKKMSADAKDKCVCRTDRVLMSSCAYLVVYFKGRHERIPQSTIGDIFHCTTASMRDCIRALAEKGVVDM